MPYFSRLMEGIGASFPNEMDGPAGASGLGGVAAMPSEASVLESDETVIAPAPRLPEREARSPAAEAAVVEQADAPISTPSGGPALEAGALARPLPSIDGLAAGPPTEAAVTAAPGPVQLSESVASAPTPARGPTETAQERVLRTLALVQQWTAANPAQDTSAMIDGPAVPTTQTRAEPVDGVLDTPGEFVIRPEARVAAMPSVASEPDRLVASFEPEIVNVSLSIGAIDVTLEAPESPAPPSRREVARPGPAAPDAASLLRRHYVRPSGGW